MKEFHWALEVAGTSFDLEDAVAIFGEESDPTVRRIEVGEGEAPITILTSPQMEALSTPDHVLGVANRLLSLVNGALFVRGAEREPLKITGLRSRRAGGNWDQHLVQEETVIARDRFGAVVAAQ
jgi:hypothetical protein